ncbi:MAG: hypothetical protein KC472_00510 [Dehalococcoidia bacterium]|nr:hypothetical protein [Dehalococcoidia bacterium]
MHAALALRAAYVHAAETLLALLLGSVQAPDCLLRWMHLYQPGDLRSMIKKIDAYERFPSKLNATRVTREQIAAAVFSPLVLDDKEQEARIERNFADLWRHIAREWARQDTTSEYNSIKHALRIHAGGFRLAMARGKATVNRTASLESASTPRWPRDGTARPTWESATRCPPTGVHRAARSFEAAEGEALIAGQEARPRGLLGGDETQ